jgi:hypothetical protein
MKINSGDTCRNRGMRIRYHAIAKSQPGVMALLFHLFMHLVHVSPIILFSRVRRSEVYSQFCELSAFLS